MPIKIQRFFRLDGAERSIFVLACIISLKHSIITSIFPMRWYTDKLGIKGNETSFTVDYNELIFVKRVERTMRRVQKYFPWKVKCFSAALTAKTILKKNNIPSTIYLGVKKNYNDKMMAHAWLRCGNIIVTGKDEMNNFTPLVYFS